MRPLARGSPQSSRFYKRCRAGLGSSEAQGVFGGGAAGSWFGVVGRLHDLHPSHNHPTAVRPAALAQLETGRCRLAQQIGLPPAKRTCGQGKSEAVVLLCLRKQKERQKQLKDTKKAQSRWNQIQKLFDVLGH